MYRWQAALRLIGVGWFVGLSILGGVLGFVFASFTQFSVYLLPIAAGGFIYISASDLIPELHKEPDRMKSFLSLLTFVLGLAILLLIKILV